MPTVLRHTLLSVRDLLVTAGPFIAMALALLAVAYWVLDPTPPKRVVLATGAAQGAYAEFGRRYQAQLKQHGITVELRPTQGAAENLALLSDPDSGVDLAFVQGGAAEGNDAAADAAQEGLVSLGSLFYEPVWLFYREDSARRLLANREAAALALPPARGASASAGPAPPARAGVAAAGSANANANANANASTGAGAGAGAGATLTSLSQLAGWRVNIGPPGSGVPNLVGKLLEANRMDPATLTLLRQPQTPAVMSLLAGEADALVFASAPESLMVQMLLKTPGIKLFDFAQAEAYCRRFPFMSPVTLPRGVVDLALDQPPADVHLVAPTATLVARDSVHPALVQLFVQAARSIHGEAGWFQRKGDFPSVRNTERPLAPEADRYYRNGPPLLQRYLPFWVANLVDRMWVVLLSIVAILIPLSRVVPPLYEFRIRSRIFRWYGQLQTLENARGQRPSADLARELDDIEARVAGITVPLSYADELYALRSHIGMVRRKLTA